MTIIPNYLKEISNYEKGDDNSLLFSLICTCGKNKFAILINENDPEFQKKEKLFSELINEYGGYNHCKIYNDSNCNLFINYKGVRGCFNKPKPIDRDILPIETKIVKAKCLNCGKEFLLYDNRIHGLNNIINSKKEYCYSNFIFKEVIANNLIKILLEYDLTVDSYNNKYLFSNKKAWEDCYSYIKVYFNTNDNKEIKIFEDHI